MTTGVKVIDQGWKKLQKDFADMLKGAWVAVGIQGSKAELETAEHGPMTNAELGAIHEWGTKDGHVPERSYLRSTLDENGKKYQKDVDNIAKQFFDLKLNAQRTRGELLLVGEKYKSDILKKINEGISPELAEVTIIRKKGETTPLINTGQLRDAIDAKVIDQNKAAQLEQETKES